MASRQSHGGEGGNSNSFEPSVAPDAPVVAFASQARNLGGRIRKAASANVYAYDWSRRRTELISRSSQGAGANSAAGVPDLSAAGRYVVFDTAATNLGGPLRTPAGAQNVYLRDRRSGRTSLVSRRSAGAGGQGADGSSSSAVISNSGRLVAFQTAATNLGGPIASGFNTYVYDRDARKATLASRATGGGPGANDYAAEPADSGKGGFVAFYTPATNIDPPGEPAYHGNFPTNTNIYRFQLAP